MSSTYSDRVLITMDHTNENPQDLADYLLDHGAKGVIICKEYHGGTKTNMEKRISDPTDDLTEDNCYHMCAAAFGKFHKQNITIRGRKYFQKKYSDLHIHWSTLYCHCNTSAKGKVTYSKWPFEDMVKYLTVSTEKKDVDPSPLVFSQGSDCTVEELLEHYEQYSDLFALVRKRKRDQTNQSDIIEELYERTQESSNQCGDVNLFLKYYYSISIEDIPLLLPSGITLYPWQQKVLSWVHQPIIQGEPNGLWMNLHAGAGKTLLLSAIYDSLGAHNIYQLSSRPGGFDLISLLGYKNEKVILVDELEFHHDDDGTPRPKSSLVEVLKRMTEKFPIAIQFGTNRTMVTPQAKVIITSNHPRLRRPDSQGFCPFERRYISLDSKEFIPEMLESKVNVSEGGGDSA